MLLRCRKSAGFRRSDEGDGAQGNRQDELGEGCTLFQAQLACDVLSQILDNGFGFQRRLEQGAASYRG